MQTLFLIAGTEARIAEAAALRGTGWVARSSPKFIARRILSHQPVNQNRYDDTGQKRIQGCANTRECTRRLVRRIKGRSCRRIQMEFPELRKRYWGRRFWARGYFSMTSGNVTDDIIKQYLELHSSK